MYKPGDLSSVHSPAAWFRAENVWMDNKGEEPKGERPPEWDSRDDDYQGERHTKPLCWLPHSSDQWVIGGPDEVRLLIADLRAFLRKEGVC